MTTFLLIFAAIHFIGLFVMLFALRSAPVGYEDATGFQTVRESVNVPVQQGATQAAHA